MPIAARPGIHWLSGKPEGGVRWEVDGMNGADDLHGLRAMCSRWFYRSGLALLKGDLRAEAQQRVIACMLVYGC